MADEDISFNISDNGTTEAFMAALQNLGVTGEDAINRLNAALPTYVNAASAAADAQEIVNGYMAAGGVAAENLKDVLATLSEVELSDAAASKSFAEALASVAQAEAAAAAGGRSLQEAVVAIGGTFETFTAGASQAAEKIQALNASEQSGISVANSYGEAQNAAGSAAASGAAKAAGASSAYTGLGGVIKTLTSYFGAYQAAMLVVKDVDIADSITQQLQSVVGAGNDTSAIFAKLAQTAEATQQPIETVAKGFTSMYAAIKDNGGTVAQAEGAIDSLSKALFDTQTPAAAAQRVLHDFSEGLATGSLNGRQLTSLLMQAPQIMGVFSQALGVNVETLTSHAQASEKAQEKLTAMKAAVDNTTQSVGSASSAYKTAETSVVSLTTKLNDENTTLTTLMNTRGDHTAAIQKEQAAITLTEAALTKEQAAAGRDGSALAVAKDAADKVTQSKIAQQQATVSAMNALSQEAVLGVLNGQKLKDILGGLATTAGGTVTGAFTSLNDKFIVYLKQTGDASVITKTFNLALGAVGDLIPVIIPALVTYGAIIAGMKISTLVASIYDWVTAQKTLDAALAITDLLLAPEVLVIGGIALAVAGVITYFGQWGTVLQGLQSLWNATVAVWGAVVTAIGDAWNYVVAQITPLTSNIMPLWNQLSQTMSDIWKSINTLWQQFASSIGLSTTQMTGLNGIWTQFKTNVSDLWTNILQPIGTFLIQTVGVLAVGAVDALIGAFNVLATVVKGILIVIQAIVSGIQAIASWQGSGSGGGTAGATPAGASRDGSNFTVAGSTGVDSKMIAVSPGEHVTIQTPMQRKLGYVNDNTPKFRDGGIFTPDDIRKAAFTASTSGSTTGYGTISPSAYYTSGTTSTAATSAASNATVSSNTDAMNNLTNVIAGPGGVATSGPATGNPLPTGGSSGSTGGSSVPSNPYDGSYVGGVQGGTSGSSGGGSTSTGENVPATSAQVAAKQKQIDSDNAALAAALVPATSGGISRPPSNLQGWSAAQSATWVVENGAIVPKSGLPITYSGDAIGARATLQADLDKPATAFRDGGDFMVPGGSGVDSRAIQLAVSPGETVSVRTPQQKQAQVDTLNAGKKSLQTPIININVSAPDANSFNKSQAQITSQLKQQLSKVA